MEVQGQPPDAVQRVFGVGFEELRYCYFVSLTEYSRLVVVTAPGHTKRANKVLTSSRVDLFQNG
jgi:hypothetical protein